MGELVQLLEVTKDILADVHIGCFLTSWDHGDEEGTRIQDVSLPSDSRCHPCSPN